MSPEGSGSLAQIVGVRKERGGAVIFAEAIGLALTPLDVVLVRFGDGQTALAMIVVGNGQIVEDEVAIEPSARIVRLATSDETRRFSATTDTSVIDAGLPPRWDAWIGTLGLSRTQQPTGETGEATSAAELIKRLFPNPPPPRAPRSRDRSK